MGEDLLRWLKTTKKDEKSNLDDFKEKYLKEGESIHKTLSLTNLPVVYQAIEAINKAFNEDIFRIILDSPEAEYSYTIIRKSCTKYQIDKLSEMITLINSIYESQYSEEIIKSYRDFTLSKVFNFLSLQEKVLEMIDKEELKANPEHEEVVNKTKRITNYGKEIVIYANRIRYKK